MRQLIALILFVGFNAQCLTKLGLVTWYSLNKEYITAKFCINKAKPAMHCGGKCFLKKQLDKFEKDAQKTAPDRSQLKQDTDYLVAVFPGNVIFWPLKLSRFEKYYECCNVPFYNGYLNSVFRPPSVTLLAATSNWHNLQAGTINC